MFLVNFEAFQMGLKCPEDIVHSPSDLDAGYSYI